MIPDRARAPGSSARRARAALEITTLGAAAALSLAVIEGVAGADERVARAIALAVVAAAALVDARTRRIPNPLVAAALLLALAGAPDRGTAALAGLAAAAPLLAFALTRPGAIGMGDVKLALAAGAVAGLAHVGALLLGTALIGGVLAIVVAVARGPRAAFAYGPAIAAALALAVR